ncbi:MAG: hypothetical protein GHCLOJNM_01645 [bacterium]|nr:hypothetical protein [bacterium]
MRGLRFEGETQVASFGKGAPRFRSALAGCALVVSLGCSISRPDPLQTSPISVLKPALPAKSDPPSATPTPEEAVLKPAATIVGGPILPKPTPGKAEERTSRVVFTGLPEPPRAEDIEQIADNLIAALDSDSLDPNSIFADEAPARAYRRKGETEAETTPSPVGVVAMAPTPAPAPSASSSAAERPAQPPESIELAQAPPVGPEVDPWGLPAAPLKEPTPGVTEFPPLRTWEPSSPGFEPAPQTDPWAEMQRAMPESVAGTTALAKAEEEEGSYRLGPGDAVDVTVWEMPDLSRNLFVRPDGFISFPLIREVKAAGRTPAELEAIIAERLSEHLIDPVVTVVVVSVGSKAYYVYGAVANPGVFQYFRQTTLLQAIVAAGGFPSVARAGQPVSYGDLSRIRIIRTHEDSREIITKNLKDLSSQEMLGEDIPIQAEDIIYVPQEARLVYVFGEVLAPGIVPVTEDTRILEVLLSVGGLRPTGRRDQVLLIRPGSNCASYACFNMKDIERGVLASNIRVRNGDIIYVPQKFIAKVAEFVNLYASAIQPALETYLTSWDAWFVHERFSALRANEFGLNDSGSAAAVVPPNPDP